MGRFTVGIFYPAPKYEKKRMRRNGDMKKSRSVILHLKTRENGRQKRDSIKTLTLSYLSVSIEWEELREEHFLLEKLKRKE